ncbi:MAG: hydroxypyruvate isomerase [Osedax symbiont Rs2]|nr:MAG: hydroxypyruvate isomerase [Osedax symbiont Rs2]
MTEFSANLSTLFTEVALLERFGLAAQAGFSAVEIQFPYSLSKTAIKQQLQKHQLKLTLINLPAGDTAAGDLGIACLPERNIEFRESVATAVDYARYLGVTKINCLAGKKPQQLSASEAQATFIGNLTYAASYLKDYNITLLIEAINTEDVPNFFLSNSAQAIKLIKEIDQCNLKFQYDLYHMQLMEGNLINTITKYFAYIGHIQIADVPNRSEPGTGEINFPNIFNALALLGYTDEIGLEYFPNESTQSGLVKLAPLLNLKGE